MTLLRVLTVVFMIVCLIITVVILLQEGKQAGLTGAISGAADTYWGKNYAGVFLAYTSKKPVINLGAATTVLHQFIWICYVVGGFLDCGGCFNHGHIQIPDFLYTGWR